jgi:uncharacterized protein (DUF2336 family)
MKIQNRYAARPLGGVLMINAQLLMLELAEAAKLGPASRRAETTQRVADLFISGSSQYSDEQIALFDDFFVRLVLQIETSARAILAGRLAAVPNAPPRVIRILAFDDLIDVAGPILTHSARLDDYTLVDNANTKGQQHLLAISRRKILSEAITDILVERGDHGVIRSIVKNRGVRISDRGFAILVRLSEGDDDLATHVGLRHDIPRHHFLRLLSKASETIKNRLEAENALGRQTIQHVVSEITNRIQTDTAHESNIYAAAQVQVQSLHAENNLGEGTIEAFAKSCKFEETAVALSLLCGLTIETVEHMIMNEHPESVLILAKSVGMSWNTTKYILWFRAGTSGIAAREMEICLVEFENLKTETAQQTVLFRRLREKMNAKHAALTRIERHA